MGPIGDRPPSINDNEYDTDRPRLNKLRKWKDPKIQRRLKIALIVFEALILFLFTSLFDVFVAYDFMPANFVVAIFKFTLAFPIWVVAIYRFFRVFDVSPEIIHGLKKYLIPYGLIILLYCYTSITFYAGFCMCIHNNTTPGLNIMKFHFSTSWWRQQMDPTCPDEQKPCMVYPTLPENGLNDVFLNFHVNPASCKDNICSPVVEYQKVGTDVWKQVTPVKTEYDHPVSEYSRREIYTALVEGLDEKSTYLFKMENSGWDNPQTEMYSYKTFDEDNFQILLGGDVGNKQGALDMNENVVKKVN